MSFSSIHNDYLDPDRHLWPEEPPEKPKIHWQIRKLLRAAGVRGVWCFYRSIYKYTDCGPSIGFCINGGWHYCDDLGKFDTFAAEYVLKKVPTFDKNLPAVSALIDHRLWLDNVFEGISISLIVEGGDAEVPAIVLEEIVLEEPCATDEEFKKAFYAALEEVNSEACYLRDRDNAIHFRIWQENGEMIFGDWKAFGEVEFTVPAYVNMVPEVVMAQAKKIMEGWCHNTKQEPVALSDGWYVSADEVFE